MVIEQFIVDVICNMIGILLIIKGSKAIENEKYFSGVAMMVPGLVIIKLSFILW